MILNGVDTEVNEEDVLVSMILVNRGGKSHHLSTAI